MFGGFLSLMRVISNFMLKELQTFNLEKSMIKRLYSVVPSNSSNLELDQMDVNE